jgi:hypothetical protein
MAGSKKYFVYTTDAGEDFALLSDESNTEAVNAGTQDYADGVVITYEIPKNLRPRFAEYVNAAGTRRIRCYALTQAVYNGIPIGANTIPDPIAGVGTLALRRLEPERLKRLPIALDTGLNDGDAT